MAVGDRAAAQEPRRTGGTAIRADVTDAAPAGRGPDGHRRRALRLEPPSRNIPDRNDPGRNAPSRNTPSRNRPARAARGGAAPSARGRWRSAGLQPSRGPAGPVRWWQRPAPGGDEALWSAVQEVHAALHRRRLTVTWLAEQMRLASRPIRRETLSRVLNGAQPTTWSTVEHLAVVLDVDIRTPLDVDIRTPLEDPPGPQDAGMAG